MSNTDFPLNDGMTDDERAYFSSGGDVSDALAKGVGGPLGGEPEPPAPVQPDPSQANGATPGGQPEPHEEDPGDEIVPGQRNPRRVSYAKYQAEQEARAGLERQLQERAVAQARLEERFSLLQQAMQPEPVQPQPDPADDRPDPTQDIFAYAAWQERLLNKVIDKVNGYEEQITVGQREMNEERDYVNSLNAYAGRDQNFMQSYNFLLRSRAAELMAERYPTATYEQLMQAEIPADIGDALRQEERSLYKNAFAGQRNPAADIVRMAQLRGWRAPQAAPAGHGNGAAAPQPSNNGAAPPRQPPGTPLAAAPAAPQPGNGAAPTATQLVEAIRRGQPAATSLSHASGNAAGTELTPQALADMPQEQFEALYNELLARGDTSKLRDLMGH